MTTSFPQSIAKEHDLYISFVFGGFFCIFCAFFILQRKSAAFKSMVEKWQTAVTWKGGHCGAFPKRKPLEAYGENSLPCKRTYWLNELEMLGTVLRVKRWNERSWESDRFAFKTESLFICCIRWVRRCRGISYGSAAIFIPVGIAVLSTGLTANPQLYVTHSSSSVAC